MIPLSRKACCRRRYRGLALLLTLCLFWTGSAQGWVGLAGFAIRGASAQASEQLIDFPDLLQHWARPVVSLLAAKGVVAGFDDGLYHPSKSLTRAQFAKLIVAGLEGSATADFLRAFGAPFSDLQGHWARGWVAAGRELGLMLGLADGRFHPDQGMNRAEVTAVLVRALGWEAEARILSEQAALASLSGYADVSAIPGWAAPYLALGSERGIIRGYSDGTLRPLQSVTRAEAAMFLARALDRLSLLFDIGGELWEIDPAGGLVLQQVWGWPSQSPAQTLRLPTNGATVWYRNGLPVEPADLGPGDRVLVVLQRQVSLQTAAALCVYSLAWDVLGVVLTSDPGAQTLALATGTNTVTVPLGSETEIYLHGSSADVATLAAGDRAYVSFDPLTGYARLVDAVRPLVSGIVAGTGTETGRQYLDIVPDPATAGSASQPAPVSRYWLTSTDDLIILAGGMPGTIADLHPGLGVLLAIPSEDGGAAAYCEVWDRDAVQAAWAGSRAHASSPAQSLFASAEDHIGRQLTDPTLELGAVCGLAEEFSRARAAQVSSSGATVGVGVSVRATGADQFWSAYHADGASVTIAVIDTGVDVSHPLLQQTSDGLTKIVDWVDFTGEGRVETLHSAASFGGYVATSLGAVRLGTPISRSGMYRSGILDESKFVGESGLGVDLDGNGRRDDRFAVVLVDSILPGVYDLAFIDTNGNRDLRDEVALSAYRHGHGYTAIGTDGGLGRGIVVTAIDRAGSHLTIGFDGNGHGTHIAGIAAGHDLSGHYSVAGMAPGAQVMALKALASDGAGSWDHIRQAIRYAAEHGAHVAVLAIEGPVHDAGVHAEFQAMADIAAEHGMVVFMAGGNSGPGSGTAAYTPDAELMVPVGGYLSAEMWSALLHQEVGLETVWLYNGAGPGSAGSGSAPLLLAPAAAVSGVPTPVADTGLMLFEGTSMAAPHAAGAAALLIDHALRNLGLNLSARAVTRALTASARPISGLTPSEQGYGVLDVMAAPASIVAGGGAHAVRIDSARSAPSVSDHRPAGAPLKVAWPVWLSNSGDSLLRLSLTSAGGYLLPSREALLLPAGLAREILLRAASGLVPGQDALSDLVVARDLDTGELLGEIVAHLPARNQLVPNSPAAMVISGMVERGKISRHFIDVPIGMVTTDLAITVQPGGPGQTPGAIEAYVCSPTGHAAAVSGTLRAGSSDGRYTVTLNSPPPGLWEIVIWGSPLASGVSSYWVECSGSALEMGVSPSRLVPESSSGAAAHATVTVTVETPAGIPDLYVEALGWMSGSEGPSTRHYVETVYGASSRVWMLPPVDQGTGLMDVSLTSLGPGDADLLIYYLRSGAQGNWLDAGSSQQPDITAERVLLWQPAPGQYAAVAEGRRPDEQLEVALTVTTWPGQTMILGQGALDQPPQGSETATRTVELNLPLPAGQSGRYRAEIIVRDAKTMLPLLTSPLYLEREHSAPLPVLAPSLATNSVRPGGNLAAPLLRVWAGGSMLPVAAEVSFGGRAAEDAGGSVRLSTALIGNDLSRESGDMPVSLAIKATGCNTWHGQIVVRGTAMGSALAGADVAGANPFGWPAGSEGLQRAMRTKINWLRHRQGQ